MKRSAWRWPLAAALALLCIALLLAWQWQTLARLAVIAGAKDFAHVRLSFGAAHVGANGAFFENVRIASISDEPIATIARLDVKYDLRDLLPGSRRLFGLESIEADSPRITIVRHADGSFNVPIPKLRPSGAGGAPLITRARVRDGSIQVVDESRAAVTDQRRQYADHVQIEANVSTAGMTTYRVTLDYGEHPDLLYPVLGRGTIDSTRGYVNQHWTAAQLPVANAVNFAINSASLRVRSGFLRDVDARYFAIPGAGARRPHLAASATFTGGRMTIAGLSAPVTNVAGPIDVFDDGLLTHGLSAIVAGIPATITGGLYGLTDPQLRVAVRGRGEFARLRNAFAQGRRLPIRGPIDFGLLVEGSPKAPMTWIALHSPQTTYAATALHDLDGLVAYDGREADVVHFSAAYGGVELHARGRVTMNEEPNAIEMLVRAHAPPGSTPYVSALLPQIPVEAAVLATATDPKAIAAGGALWGASGTQSLAAIFRMNDRGSGSIGPLEARNGNGVLYARIALNRPSGSGAGLVQIRNFALPDNRGTLNGAFVGSETGTSIQALGDAAIESALGPATMHARIALRNGALQGTVLGRLGSEVSFGADVGGKATSPAVAGTVVVAGGRYRNFNVDGNAGLTYERGTLNVHDTAVAIGPLFVGVSGTVRGLLGRATFAPQYDLAAQLHSSNVSTLVATVAPAKASLVQGSIDANLRVRGTGMAPSFSGSVRAPEGSINGLSFRDFDAAVTGDSSAIAVDGGRVIVGSSPIALDATASRAGAAAFSLNAPHIDLADFNDLFDTGDTFAGTGSLQLQGRTVGMHLLASAGSTAISNARFRRIDLGSVAARWSGSGGVIATALQFGGPTGKVALRGTIAPVTRSLDVTANARDVDLSTWLPMLGYNVPVTGRLDATTTLAGTYPDLAMRARAAVFGGTVGRMAIERFEVTASALHGRGTIESAVLDVPSMDTVASGTFGLRPTDPLALEITSTTPNFGDFLKQATGKDFGVSGSLNSTLQVRGTRNDPRLSDAVTLQRLRYRALTIPRVTGDVVGDRHSFAVRNGEIDLVRGKALLSVALPIAVTGSRIAPARGPISGSIAAQDVELSNFAELLPKGTQLSGRLDGRVNAAGTAASPDLNGTLSLADGTFNGPMERSPITGISGTLAFEGTQARLQSHAFVGTGTVTASAIASLSDLARPANATFTFSGTATNARLDLPAYFQGDVNGAVALVRTPGSPPRVSGDVTVSKARLPLSAFLRFNKSGGTAPRLPNIAFDDLNFNVGNDVRVQSANVDIGTTGAVRLGGTLNTPTLSGAFRSTGGSLSFYRSFNVERGAVSFNPTSGLIPDVDAVATTFVPNPATAIRLHVTGPVTNMNLALASDPSYSREQILGILIGAQQFGAVRGVQSTGGTFSTSSAARSLALGQVNTVFTRNLLEPLSTSVGSALGFTEVQITSDLQTGIGVNAVKAFGKYVTAIFNQTFGYPQTQSIALEFRPTEVTGYRLMAFSSSGPTLFALQQPQPAAASVLNVNPATSFTPLSGSNGVSFSVVRRYW